MIWYFYRVSYYRKTEEIFNHLKMYFNDVRKVMIKYKQFSVALREINKWNVMICIVLKLGSVSLIE